MKSEWGDKYPSYVGLNHDEPSVRVVLKFYDRMLSCSDRELQKKWFRHFMPLAVTMSGMDLKDALGPGGELPVTGWRCIHRMLSEKERKMCRKGLARWRGVFDPCFVEELCKPDNELTRITSARRWTQS